MLSDEIIKTKAQLDYFIRRNPNWKEFLGVIFAVSVIVYASFKQRPLYVFALLAEMLRTFGVLLLVTKIQTQRSVAGLSLRTQELFVICFASRFGFKVFVEKDLLYPVVEGIALAATCWIVWAMRTRYKITYEADKDTFRLEFLIVPIVIVSLVLYPTISKSWFLNFIWAFSTYLESVTLLPQLFFLQKSGRMESITAHYMVCLGLSRFLECCFWIIAFIMVNFGKKFTSLLWFVVASEAVHTLLLADFYYYYFKSWRTGGPITLGAV